LTSATVEPARFDIPRCASGGIIWSSGDLRFDLGIYSFPSWSRFSTIFSTVEWIGRHHSARSRPLAVRIVGTLVFSASSCGLALAVWSAALDRSLTPWDVAAAGLGFGLAMLCLLTAAVVACDAFGGSEIARSYEVEDGVLRRLVAAFGDATVVLVSDHGWSYDDYLHFSDVNGVLAVTPGNPAGNGGVADIGQLAPLVLNRLGISPSVHQFISAGEPGAKARIERLRSLGYIGSLAH